MMTGNLIIDGVDAFDTYGAYLVAGGFNDLAALPPLKAVTSNDWQEEDGIEVDLSAPVLDTRTLSLKFAICGADLAAYTAFTEFLRGSGRRTYNFASMDRVLSLRLVECTGAETYSRFGFVQVKLADDFPLSGYTYLAPSSDMTEELDYTLDGTAFTDYGVRILEGGLSELIRGSAVKIPLLRNIASQSGAIYDEGATLHYKSRDVKIKCHLRAPSTSALWRNADALLYDLVRPGFRTLGCTALGGTFKCHYKSCSVSDFILQGGVWLNFTLVLTLIEGRMATT